MNIIIQTGQTHYDDVIMSMMGSQITSLTVVYSTVYSDANQWKIKAPRHWPLCGEFTGRWIPRTKGQLRGKCFHLMTSSWFTHVIRAPLSRHVRNCDLIRISSTHNNNKPIHQILDSELKKYWWNWSFKILHHKDGVGKLELPLLSYTIGKL